VPIHPTNKDKFCEAEFKPGVPAPSGSALKAEIRVNARLVMFFGGAEPNYDATPPP
jgi:hypothetical protein